MQRETPDRQAMFVMADGLVSVWIFRWVGDAAGAWVWELEHKTPGRSMHEQASADFQDYLKENRLHEEGQEQCQRPRTRKSRKSPSRN